MVNGTVEGSRERFTVRLEAFSDLVFGFSLSLLATRLDVPARVEDIFDSTRWLAIIGTFGFVCRFWLEHCRIFRHHFVARTFDAIVNFVFLFAIAVLPYALQTFLRLQVVPRVVHPLCWRFLPHSAQPFAPPCPQSSATPWGFGCCRTIARLAPVPDAIWVAILLGALLLALHYHAGTFESGMREYDIYVLGAFVLISLLTRRGVRRLPGFLVA
jgi:Endosomal/lysosomal potassium channel TMEM175